LVVVLDVQMTALDGAVPFPRWAGGGRWAH